MTQRQRELERLASAMLADGPKSSGFIQPRTGETVAIVPRETERDRWSERRKVDRLALQRAYDRLAGPDRRRMVAKFKQDRSANPFLDWVEWLSQNL